MSLLDLYCRVDDFYRKFAPKWERIQIEDGLTLMAPWLVLAWADEDERAARAFRVVVGGRGVVVSSQPVERLA